MKVWEKVLLLNCCLLLITSFAFTQNYSISGYVTDSSTREPLPFVNILMNDGNKGGMTDINGYFKLKNTEPIYKLRLSYVGYYPLIYNVTATTALRITLSREIFPLSEVTIIAGENPAHRIIRNVLNNRKLNDPKYYKNYKYTSYDKMVYNVDIDSAEGYKRLAKGDSVMFKVKKLMDKQHVFIMENVAEQQFKYPESYYNKVIATKASGIKDPSFYFLISQTQPNSFYDEVIKMGLKNYINPISSDFDKLYHFRIRDTILNETNNDTTFIISFEKAKGKTFDALTGLVYITTRQWAITNVIARPSVISDGLGFRIQQQYELIDSTYWFPVQLNTELTIYNYVFQPLVPTGSGKSYRTDIVINSPDFIENTDNVTIEVQPDANLHGDDYWVQYRIDSLNSHDVSTYHFLDSLLSAGQLDFIEVMTSVIKGSIPLGYVDLHVGDVYRYNQYEKAYFGAGFYTNEKVTEAGSIGGYVGYGIGDNRFKYGGSLRINLKQHDDFFIKLRYNNHLEESGGIRLAINEPNPLFFATYLSSYVSRFDRVESYDASVTFKHFRYFMTQAGIMKARKSAMFNYRWNDIAEIEPLYKTNDFGYLSLCTRFAFREKYIRADNTDIPIGTKYPVLWLQYTAARKGLLAGDYTFDKIDFQLKYSRFTQRLGTTTWILQGGALSNDVPYSEMYSGLGSSLTFFSVLASGSFTTMKPSEFLNDRFIALYTRHNFGKLMNSKLIEPEFSVVLNVAFGSLNHPENHTLANLKTMELGYYETGLLIDHFFRHTLSTLGIGAFYRFGPYSYEKTQSNIMLRMVFGL